MGEMMHRLQLRCLNLKNLIDLVHQGFLALNKHEYVSDIHSLPVDFQLWSILLDSLQS